MIAGKGYHIMQPRHVLDGFKILEVTSYLTGPSVTRLSMEMGAEVTKAEIVPASKIAHLGGVAAFPRR